jgi:protein SCO1/2
MKSMDKKIIWVGVVSFLLVGLAVVFAVFFAKTASFRGTAYSEPYLPAPEIVLQKADGETYRLSDQKGRLTLIFFGFTSCPDVCPTTLADLSVALHEMDADPASVQVIFVSVDPQRDTPEKIQEYVERFNAAFIGLSGTEEQLQPIWQNYGVFREIVPGSTELNYTVNHTARVILIDPDGNMRLSYGFETLPVDIAHDIDVLLSN